MSAGPALVRFRGWLSRERRRRLSEAGYAAVMVAIVVPTVGIGCAAVAVDTGAWYVEQQMAQKTADAAALGGVPFLPQDFASAKARALEIAARNGYDNVGDDKVTVELGDKPTQLKVTVQETIRNTFGAAIGIPTTTVRQSGTADYQGPAPMGSPCNTFGNEPDAGAGSSSPKPTGTAQGTSPFTNCYRSPKFWATVEGPETAKSQGDRYQTTDCGATAGVDGCTNGKNDEYDDFGYVFVVRVTQALVTAKASIELQLYDPMFVDTGPDCANLSASTYTNDTNSTNPYVKNNDARNRYTDDGTGSAGYCPGDYFPGGGSAAMTTSFALRQQTDTQNPEIAPVQNDTSGSACIKQYGSFNASASSFPNLLKQGASGYNAEIASQFHNWVKFCSFTPTDPGDYYLQVRTNVAMGNGTGYIRAGNDAVLGKGNSSTGEGDNSFAIRAVTSAGQEKNVAVSGYNHMPIFVNYTAATAQFNLIRVLPGAAGQKISFSYYDAGDATSAGSVQVLPPGATTNGVPDATGSVLTTPFPGGCTAYGGSAGGSQSVPTALSNCTAPFVQDPLSTTSPKASKNNGKTETITIPIPSDYSCNYNSPAGCWYQVKLNYGNTSTSTVNDITTWDATIVGDPVRLIE